LQADWPLQIGQKLLIDPGNVTPSPTPRPLSAIEQLTPASDGNYYHIVKDGEFLAWIADLYDVNLADLIAWNGLTSASILQPGQQMILRVTPPATITPIPVLPSVTSTITQTPNTPTYTQELTTALPSVIATADVEVQPSLSGMGALLVVVLVVTGLLVLGWAARRK
jgi:LysM repeat protein